MKNSSREKVKQESYIASITTFSDSIISIPVEDRYSSVYVYI